MHPHDHTMTGPDKLDHARYCTEIAEQTRLLRHALVGADLTARVPTCPDWTLRELAVHVGGAHRWVNEIVRSRAEDDVPDDAVPAFDGPASDGPDALDAWLAEGAELLTAALREAGPAEPVWTWTARRETGFWARRMTHETVVHRADASLTAGLEYAVEAELAADCIEEWLEIVSSPEAQEEDEELAELRERAGESLHLHATDVDAFPAEWLIELGRDGITWRRAHARATVAVRGPLTEVLGVFCRRLPPDSDRVQVLGDAELLDFWLTRTGFGG